MLRILSAVWLACIAATQVPAAQGPPKTAFSGTTVTLKRVLPELGASKRLRIRENKIFILSRTGGPLLVLDREYKVERRIGSIGGGPGDLDQPEDFDVAADGTIWVADRGSDRVLGFSREGDVLGAFQLRAPSSIAALPSGELAIVQQFDSEVIRIFDRKGLQIRTIGEITNVPGATDAQTNYYNRARLTATNTGEILAAFRFLIPPTAKMYTTDGGLKASFVPSSVHVTAAMKSLSQMRVEDMKKRNLGGRLSLTGFAVDGDGYIWLAPAGITTVFKFTPDARQVQEYRFKGADGLDLGIQDLVVDGRHVLAISGPFLVSGTLPPQ